MVKTVDEALANFKEAVRVRRAYLEWKGPEGSCMLDYVEKMNEVCSMIGVLGLTKAEVNEVFKELDLKNAIGKRLKY